jgi:conjugal transfer mating pair stabilization protein TraN
MYSWALVFIGCLSFATLRADNMTDGHAQGASWANGQLGIVQDKAKSTAASEVPGFKTDNPAEASLDNGSIDNAAIVAAQSNGAATYISEHARERKSFKLDPNTDPMFVNANQAIANPEKTLNEIVMEVPGGNGNDEDEIVTCEEGGDEYVQKCSKHLEVQIRITPPTMRFAGYTYPNRWYSDKSGQYRCGNGCCSDGTGCKRPQYSITNRKVEITSERWIDGCASLEEMSDRGLCRYVELDEGTPETRTVVGEVINVPDAQETPNTEPINRDSWQKNYTYKCLKKVEGDCHKLSAKGCVQIASTCTEKMGDVCIAWKQTYRCPNKKQKQTRYKSIGEKTPFCFTGDCVNADYEANGELANAMTHLAVLKEAQDDIRSKLGIFKGQSRRCRKAWNGARDCCGSGNRWAVSWKMAPGCDTQEKELGDWRAKRRCVEVGTFCSQKLPIIGCIEKKTTFCCFGTKLSKLIQEQGRAQLGMSWGSPESPECRGLTTEELSRLDFSTMDLSELFADVSASFKPKSQDHIAKGIELERIRENMKHLAPKSKQDLEQEYKNFADHQTKQQETIAQLRAQRAIAQKNLTLVTAQEAETAKLKERLALCDIQAKQINDELLVLQAKNFPFPKSHFWEPDIFGTARREVARIQLAQQQNVNQIVTHKTNLLKVQENEHLLKQQYQTAVDKQILKRANVQEIINDLDKKIDVSEKLLQQLETEHQAKKEAAERRSL